MTVKLLTKQHFEFLSLKGGCRGWSESTLVKLPHCLKSHVMAHIVRKISVIDYNVLINSVCKLILFLVMKTQI